MILYEFCKQNYPEYQIQASIAWIEAGMSLKKLPAEKVWTKRQIPPATWNIIYGEYKESLRLCFLPADEKGEHGYWFGFESEIQKQVLYSRQERKTLLHQEKLLVSKVMLDFDLVSLYRSETKRLKESNKSNPGKNQRKR